MATRIHKIYGRTPKEVRQKARKEFGEDFSIVKMNRVSGRSLLKPDKNSNYELIIAIESEVETTAPLVRTKQKSPDPTNLKDAISRVNTLLSANAYTQQMEVKQDLHSVEISTKDVEMQGESSHVPYADPPDFAEEDNNHKQAEEISRPNNSSDLYNYLGSELTEIRDVLHILLNNVKTSDIPDLPDEVTGLYQKFLKHDVDQTLAYDLAEAMEDCFHDEKGRSIHQHLTALLRKIVKTSGGIQFKTSPTVVALVGPTGVGKTTTIAKLAVQYKFKGKKVVLITTDDFRIGAIEQLTTYAEILSLPMEVAHEPEELEDKITQHNSADLILLDTPGRSQLDQPRIRSIESFLNSACPDETHLLINMTTRNQDIQSMISRFGSLGVDRLVFTKLDEANCLGPILNSSLRFKKPISFFTTGQDVAGDIEIASHNRMATFLLRGFQARVKKAKKAKKAKKTVKKSKSKA